MNFFLELMLKHLQQQKTKRDPEKQEFFRFLFSETKPAKGLCLLIDIDQHGCCFCLCHIILRAQAFLIAGNHTCIHIREGGCTRRRLARQCVHSLQRFPTGYSGRGREGGFCISFQGALCRCGGYRRIVPCVLCHIRKCGIIYNGRNIGKGFAVFTQAEFFCDGIGRGFHLPRAAAPAVGFHPLRSLSPLSFHVFGSLSAYGRSVICHSASMVQLCTAVGDGNDSVFQLRQSLRHILMGLIFMIQINGCRFLFCDLLSVYQNFSSEREMVVSVVAPKAVCAEATQRTVRAANTLFFHGILLLIFS